MSFQGHPRSIKVIWVYQFVCIPIGYHVVKNDENMKMSYKDICPHMLSTWHFGPIWPDSVSSFSRNDVSVSVEQEVTSYNLRLTSMPRGVCLKSI